MVTITSCVLGFRVNSKHNGVICEASDNEARGVGSIDTDEVDCGVEAKLAVDMFAVTMVFPVKLLALVSTILAIVSMVFSERAVGPISPGAVLAVPGKSLSMLEGPFLSARQALVLFQIL